MEEQRNRSRLYNETETGALIQLATEIQHDTTDSPERGLSLREIEQIAVDLGIAPEHLRAAAIQLENRSSSGMRRRLWGGPFVIDQRRHAESRLTEEQWEQIVLELRRRTGSTGRVDAFGQILEWTRTVEDMGYLIEQTQVTISPRDNRTTIDVRKQFRGGARMAYVLSAIFGVTVAGIFLDGGGLSDLMNAVIAGGGGVGGLAVARLSLGYWTIRQRERLKELADWLYETISPSGSGTSNAQVSVEQPEHLEPPERVY